MPDRTRALCLLLGGIFALVSLGQLWSAWSFPRGIWWTGADVPLTVEGARDRVEIRVRGVPLETALREGRLTFDGAEGRALLAPEDLQVRLENRDHAMVQQLPAWLLAAAVLGAGGMAVLLAALGLVRGRPSEGPPHA